MSLATDCPGCITGDHSHHVRDHHILPGLIGGEYCPCSGDCAERAEAAFAASPFAQALNDLARKELSCGCGHDWFRHQDAALAPECLDCECPHYHTEVEATSAHRPQ